MDIPVDPTPSALASRKRLSDRIGDAGLKWVTATAAFAATTLLVFIAYKLVDAAWPAIQEFGPSFVWSQEWNPVTGRFGALDFLYGTAVTSFCAMLLAAPLSIAIGLYLAELAPSRVRGPIGSLVETLAAIPSVVLGLWGILVLGPWVRDYIAPWLNDWLGFIPIFSGTPQQAGMLVAIIVLTMMMIPISASICRDLFLTVPTDIKEGAYGLGLTRWEMIRGVILPFTRGGVVGAVLLGAGRAIGEAIAVTQVIGGALAIPTSLFDAGDTLASRIAAQYQGAVSNLHVASIIYLGLVLMVFSLLTNMAAQTIVARSERRLGR